MLGTEVFVETVLEISEDGHQSVSWSGHGFRLIIPAGAVVDGTTISLAVKAIRNGESDLQVDCQLTSATYCVHVSQLCDRDVELNLEQSGVTVNEAECSDYQLVAGQSSQADHPHHLKTKEREVFTPPSYKASISRKQVSLYGITRSGRRRKLRDSYVSLVFYQPLQGEYVWQVDFVVTQCIGSLVKVCLLYGWLLL